MKRLVEYFVIRRKPDQEPFLMKHDFAFTDDVKVLERKLRFTHSKDAAEAAHTEIVLRAVEQSSTSYLNG